MNKIEPFGNYNSKPVLIYRKQQLERLSSFPYPSTGGINNKYFDKDGLDLKRIALLRTNKITTELKEKFSGQSNVIVFYDGNIVYESLSSECDDIYINDMELAFNERPEIANDLLLNEDKFVKGNRKTAENSACFTSGYLIHIPNHIVLQQDIKIYNYSKQGDFLNRAFIVLGENTKATITEFVEGDNCYLNKVSDIYLKSNASLNYSLIDTFNKAKGYVGVRAHLSQYANANINKFYLSNIDVVSDIVVNLAGTEASVDVNTIAITNGKHKQVVNVETINNATNSSASVQNYGAAFDQSSLIFNNYGKITAQMKGSKAYQSTKGLIMSNTATVQANPFLIIDEYDVEAGHGATIGAFDMETMFYLMSRGLSKEEAESLITAGFFKPLMRNLHSINLRESILKIITKKMESNNV